MKSIGEIVRERRKFLRLTQEELARLAGCSIPTVINLEQGKKTLRFDVLYSVLNVLGLEIEIRPRRRGE